MRLFLLVLLFLVPTAGYAFEPIMVELEGQHDVIDITRPEASRAYYGELQNHPHTFLVLATSSFDLNVQIFSPDIRGAKINLNGIIVRELGGNDGVEEVTRMPSGRAEWEGYREPTGGDRYLAGPTFSAELESGSYIVEVSNPENLGKYVLAFGAFDQIDGDGYIDTVRNVATVKIFLGKTWLGALTASLVYIPLLILLILGGVVYYGWRRLYRESGIE